MSNFEIQYLEYKIRQNIYIFSVSSYDIALQEKTKIFGLALKMAEIC